MKLGRPDITNPNMRKPQEAINPIAQLRLVPARCCPFTFHSGRSPSREKKPKIPERLLVGFEAAGSSRDPDEEALRGGTGAGFEVVFSIFEATVNTGNYNSYVRDSHSREERPTSLSKNGRN